MKSKRPLIRRTFLQERFDILIKKQRNGHATFSDLTELDDIVNRDPAIRESILEEMHEHNHPTHGPQQEEKMITQPTKPAGLLDQLKTLINRWFIIPRDELKAALIN